MTAVFVQAAADIVAFIFTNLDQFVILIMFFAETRMVNGPSVLQVCVGTCFGFTVIVGLSLLGLVFGLFVPAEWLGIAGFLPILLGLYKLAGQCRKCVYGESESAENASDVNDAYLDAVAPTPTPALALAPPQPQPNPKSQPFVDEHKSLPLSVPDGSKAVSSGPKQPTTTIDARARSSTISASAASLHQSSGDEEIDIKIEIDPAATMEAKHNKLSFVNPPIPSSGTSMVSATPGWNGSANSSANASVDASADGNAASLRRAVSDVSTAMRPRASALNRAATIDVPPLAKKQIGSDPMLDGVPAPLRRKLNSRAMTLKKLSSGLLDVTHLLPPRADTLVPPPSAFTNTRGQRSPRSPVDDGPVVPISSVGYQKHDLSPDVDPNTNTNTNSAFVDKTDNAVANDDPLYISTHIVTQSSCCYSMFSAHTANVLLLTLANSGDNIGIYLPLFAADSVASMVEMIIIFYLLLAVLFVLAWLMVQCKFIADTLQKYGEYIMPWPLIGVGIYILSGSIVFHPHA